MSVLLFAHEMHDVVAPEPFSAVFHLSPVFPVTAHLYFTAHTRLSCSRMLCAFPVALSHQFPSFLKLFNCWFSLVSVRLCLCVTRNSLSALRLWSDTHGDEDRQSGE